MILDSMLVLRALVIGTNTAAAQSTVDYKDWNQEGNETNPATYRIALGTSTSTSTTTILPSPGLNPIRDPFKLAIYNPDAAAITLRLDVYNGSSSSAIAEVQQSLGAGKTLAWEKNVGYYIL